MKGRLRRLRTPMLAALVGLLVAVGGGWLWLRDSALVSVERVTVTGEHGPDAALIRRALIAAAHSMTTLDVRMDALRTAVAPFPVVKGLRVSTQFPHGMRITVIERLPVGAVVVDGRSIAVAADGTLLHDVPPDRTLPVIPLRVPPGGERVTESDALSAVAVLAAAPAPMLTRVSQVTTVAGRGLVAQVRGGPSIYFGDASELVAKWVAASEVLADPGSSGATYIDVTDPHRPAAGAGAGALAASTGVSGTGGGSGIATGGAVAAAPASSASTAGAGQAASTGASQAASADASPPAATGAGTATSSSGG